MLKHKHSGHIRLDKVMYYKRRKLWINLSKTIERNTLNGVSDGVN